MKNELYRDDDEGKLVPRIITGCGHTACNDCLRSILTRVNATGNAKLLKCPLCKQVTSVSMGKATNLPKNFAVL